MKMILIVNIVALGISIVALTGLFVLYLRTERKLAKYRNDEVKKHD